MITVDWEVILRLTVLLLLFFIFSAWFFSQYEKPILRLVSGILIIASGYAAEARFANLMWSGGEISLLIADLLTTLILFFLGIMEFKRYFDTIWFNRRKK